MAEKLFTPALADAALPLVRQIVADVVESHRRLVEAATRYQVRRRDAAASQVELNEMRRLTLELESRRAAYAAELAEIGVELKDAEIGLVDFPAELDGARVLLCWKHGEPRVEWWHGETEGFAGRKPLPVPVFT